MSWNSKIILRVLLIIGLKVLLNLLLRIYFSEENYCLLLLKFFSTIFYWATSNIIFFLIHYKKITCGEQLIDFHKCNSNLMLKHFYLDLYYCCTLKMQTTYVYVFMSHIFFMINTRNTRIVHFSHKQVCTWLAYFYVCFDMHIDEHYNMYAAIRVHYYCCYSTLLLSHKNG